MRYTRPCECFDLVQQLIAWDHAEQYSYPTEIRVAGFALKSFGGGGMVGTPTCQKFEPVEIFTHASESFDGDWIWEEHRYEFVFVRH